MPPHPIQRLITRHQRAELPCGHDRCVSITAVMATLKAGDLDEVSARRVGLSLRHYRRYVAGLLHLVGVRTRFQLGMNIDRVPAGCLDEVFPSWETLGLRTDRHPPRRQRQDPAG